MDTPSHVVLGTIEHLEEDAVGFLRQTHTLHVHNGVYGLQSIQDHSHNGEPSSYQDTDYRWKGAAVAEFARMYASNASIHQEQPAWWIPEHPLLNKDVAQAGGGDCVARAAPVHEALEDIACYRALTVLGSLGRIEICAAYDPTTPLAQITLDQHGIEWQLRGKKPQHFDFHHVDSFAETLQDFGSTQAQILQGLAGPQLHLLDTLAHDQFRYLHDDKLSAVPDDLRYPMKEDAGVLLDIGLPKASQLVKRGESPDSLETVSYSLLSLHRVADTKGGREDSFIVRQQTLSLDARAMAKADPIRHAGASNAADFSPFDMPADSYGPVAPGVVFSPPSLTPFLFAETAVGHYLAQHSPKDRLVLGGDVPSKPICGLELPAVQALYPLYQVIEHQAEQAHVRVPAHHQNLSSFSLHFKAQHGAPEAGTDHEKQGGILEIDRRKGLSRYTPSPDVLAWVPEAKHLSSGWNPPNVTANELHHTMTQAQYQLDVTADSLSLYVKTSRSLRDKTPHALDLEQTVLHLAPTLHKDVTDGRLSGLDKDTWTSISYWKHRAQGRGRLSAHIASHIDQDPHPTRGYTR